MPIAEISDYKNVLRFCLANIRQHMMEMYGFVISHDGLSVVECLIECVEFYRAAFDAAIPRKEVAFEVIDEEKHDVTDMSAALTLAEEAWPGKFGVYYHKSEPTKNELKKDLIDKAQRPYRAFVCNQSSKKVGGMWCVGTANSLGTWLVFRYHDFVQLVLFRIALTRFCSIFGEAFRICDK